MSRLRLIVSAVLVCAASARVGAEVYDPFAFEQSGDELALGRLADRVGDTALAVRLRPESPRYEALIAIRASEHARAPELLIPALAALACGRDPALAPEAAHVLRTLAGLLRPSALAERETLRSDLQAARAALRCSDPPRPDIAATLQQVAQVLATLD